MVLMHGVNGNQESTHVCGLVEAQVLVQRGYGLNLIIIEVEAEVLEVLLHASLAAALGNDGDAALGGPAQQHLGGGLAVLVGDGLDGGLLHERDGVLGAGHVELDEAGGAEAGVGGDGDALGGGGLEQQRLDEVWVVLDLQGGGLDAGVAQEVVEQLGLEVGHADAAGEALVGEALHGLPGLLDGGLGGADLGAGVVDEPARRVADRGVDVLEGDGEVDEVEVEVVDAPVGQLAAGDGLDAVAVVEAVPQLGDDEEVLALHQAVLDGASDTLTALLLVAIVCWRKRSSALSTRKIEYEFDRGLSCCCFPRFLFALFLFPFLVLWGATPCRGGQLGESGVGDHKANTPRPSFMPHSPCSKTRQ